MQTAALIVAAGKSSRMGQFKPMLSIGSISVAQRVVATLSQAGVSKIIMVTGCNATMLERHLSGNGIIFLRNELYATRCLILPKLALPTCRINVTGYCLPQ